MNIRFKIRNIIFRCLNKLYRYYNSLYCENQFGKCSCGAKTKFYEGSEVINLQSNPLKIEIGSNTHIRGKILIYPYGNGITIGDNSYIGENSIIRAADNIQIGNNVLIAHNVTIIDTNSHEIDYQVRAESYEKMIENGHPQDKGDVETAPIIIMDNAWISYNVCVLKGVTIGQGAIIGAGSVVTSDIPDFSIAVGNPARVIRYI